MSKKIFVDAGHGGKDPGALGGEYKESDIALQIALKIKSDDPNFEFKYSRTSDTYPTIGERCRMANAEKADVFVSIHLNAAANFTAQGIETLCYSASGKSYELAKTVQEELVKVTGAINRGVKIRPDLGVLRGTNMPAILVEVGFISNTEERKKLINERYQDKIAATIVEKLKQFFRG